MVGELPYLLRRPLLPWARLLKGNRLKPQYRQSVPVYMCPEGYDWILGPYSYFYDSDAKYFGRWYSRS